MSRTQLIVGIRAVTFSVITFNCFLDSYIVTLVLIVSIIDSIIDCIDFDSKLV